MAGGRKKKIAGVCTEDKMLSVLCNWIYILFTTTCLGYGFSKLVIKKLNYQIKKFESLIAIGLVIATVYAQFFSLFYKVGLIANIALVSICIFICIVFRKDFYNDIRNHFANTSVAKRIIILFLIVFWAYFSSRGYMHYDSDLYHAQSIRWIEEYGVIKGLGNVHNRLAYNSSFFAVSALYSMKFLVGQSLHSINGFMTLLLSISVLDIMDSVKRKRFILSDYIRIATIYYLTVICDEIVSPASDFAIMCTIFYIVIKWVDLLEKKEKDIAPYALLCVGGVYAVSLKLTAGLVLILLIKPAYRLIKEKKVKEIFIYLSMGFIVILPWVIRNVIISGYLVYPFPELDIFSFAWKIDPNFAAKDAAEIKVWGRGLYDVALVDMPVWQWFENWFKSSLSGTEKLIILADIVCLVIALIITVYVFVKKKWEHLDYLLVELMIICSYGFWQLSAPLIRYGYAYALILIVLTLGFIKMHIGFDKIVCYGIIILGIVKLLILLKYAHGFWYFGNYLWQKDYGIYETESYEIEGEIFYYPALGDQIGYEPFPAVSQKKELEFIGDEIRDGFIGR